MHSIANRSFILSLFLLIFRNVFGDTRADKEKQLELKLGYPLDSTSNFTETAARYVSERPSVAKRSFEYPPDSVSNFTELATKHGYVAEQHSVTTDDGYILTMFRINKGKNCNGPIKKPPVLLMHGLLMSSDSFIDSGPEAGLAYLISDLCYDLWVPNVRGNYYSKRHIKLDPAVDKDFWDFSNYEFGYYDVPAFIDYILSYTKSAKLNYIGFSQGCSTFFIMNSKRPEYNNKIGVGILLAPVARKTYTRSLLFRLLCETYELNYHFLSEIGQYEALPLGGPVQKISSLLCNDTIAAITGCKLALGLFDSLHPGSIKTETIKVLFGHFPAGTSVKNMAWCGQAVNIDVFQNFDYGADKNLQVYGSVRPPAYNLSSVEVPIVVIHGRNDNFAAPADVEWVTSKLPNVLEKFYVEDPLWNHFDVTYSRLTSKYIVPKISEYLEKY